MLAMNKTKAALPGRLSHFSNFTENNTTLIDQVNACKSAHIFSNYGKPPQHLTEGGIPPLEENKHVKELLLTPYLIFSSCEILSAVRNRLCKSINYYSICKFDLIKFTKYGNILTYPPYAQIKVPSIVKAIPKASDFISSFTSVSALARFSLRILMESAWDKGGPVTPLREEISAERLDIFFNVVNFIVYINPKTEIIAPALANKFMSLRTCPKTKLNTQNIMSSIRDVFAPRAASKKRRKNFIKEKSFCLITFRKISLTAGFQPLGLMPCLRSSALAKPFNQFPRLTPSLDAASFSCCLNSGVIRIWKVGDRPSPLAVLSLFIVDMYVRNLIVCIFICTYVITFFLQKATPLTVGAVTGRLTTNDRISIEAAMENNTTHPQGRNSLTPNKFTWRFLAVSESHPQARAIVVYTNAHTETEARSHIKGCVLYFAARLPAHYFGLSQEVNHA